MDRDAKSMRGTGPTVFAEVKNGKGVPAIIDNVLASWAEATGADRGTERPTPGCV